MKRSWKRRLWDFAVAVMLVGLLLIGLWLFVKQLDHPGEQHISGSEYTAQIAQYAPEQTAAELIVLPVEEPALYDVPLDKELQKHIVRVCEEYGVEPAIVLAVIGRESNYRAEAIGDGGDSLGMCQVQPRWHYDRMERLNCPDLLDPYQNVVVGIDYLAECIERYDGDVAKGLVAYNQGHFKETITDYALAVLDMAETLRH